MDKDSVKPLAELLDTVRDIDGFPIGNDEDILALSDPPFYTACPNPYVQQFIEEYGKSYDPEHDDYKSMPFIENVEEGKDNPIYNAHSYHTKVPHKAIMKYIEHYTNEGDIVLDAFCGTGMTGVAAQLLNRKAILSDLSPAATFIAYNYNTPINDNVPDTSEVSGTSGEQLEVPGTSKVPETSFGIKAFEREAKRILKEVGRECGWMYETLHTDGKAKGIINFTVWSDVFICPYCQNEYVFWEVAVEQKKGKVQDEYGCPQCNAIITKRESKRTQVSFFDSAIGKQITQYKQVPVLINYSVGKKRFEKIPDEFDIELIHRIEKSEIPYWFPTLAIPKGVKTSEPLRLGLTHIHHFYTKRNLWVVAAIWDKIKALNLKRYSNIIALICTAIMPYASKMRRFRANKKGGGPLSGTLYFPSLITPPNVLLSFERNINFIGEAVKEFAKYQESNLIFTQSTSDLKLIPANSIDYVFTDPPFGHNIMYSELNLLWEAWLRVLTNNKDEAIINKSQKKGLNDYRKLMTACFKEYCRVLKPNRWITIVFHNARASVWNVIQETITRAGFIITQVSVLDKQQETFNQVTALGAVKNDLIINAYKPKREFSERFLKRAGEGMEVDFVTQLLEHLPVEPNIGRTEQMLYSKMLAHYVENGFKIRYNAHTFYKLLDDHFTKLDDYWFLDSQVPRYNEWKSQAGLETLKTIREGQRILFISDEKSALTWLYHFLETAQEYSDIYTAYQKVSTKTDDVIPELRELLDHNFILEGGRYRRPLSTEERELITQNRERELDRAFQKLLQQAQAQKGKLRNVRREALVHGFTKCYQESKYHDILTIADRLPAKTIEASGDVMDFVDIARLKTAGEEELKLL